MASSARHGQQRRDQGAEIRREAQEEGPDDAGQDGVREGRTHEGHAAENDVRTEAGAGRTAERDSEQGA